MDKPKRLKLLLIIISVVVLFHLFLLLYVEPSFFSFMLPSPRTLTERSSQGAAAPDAILYIPVEIDESAPDENVTQLVEEPEAENTIAPTDKIPPLAEGSGSSAPPDIGDIAGDASRPLPQSPGIEPVRIPPRPLQITWPDTRRLKDCLGHQIDVKVQVDGDGRILAVEASPSSSPPECVRAAVECAKQIVFAPGKVNGRPIKMWTEIRIDFRGRNEP